MFVACCLLLVVWPSLFMFRLLCVVCRVSFFDVRCWFCVCCLLFVVCRVLFVVCGFVVCCRWFLESCRLVVVCSYVIVVCCCLLLLSVDV